MSLGETYVDGPAKGRGPDARLQDRGFQGTQSQADKYNNALIDHLRAHPVPDNRRYYYRYRDEAPATYIEDGDTCTYPVLVGSQSVLRTIEIA